MNIRERQIKEIQQFAINDKLNKNIDVSSDYLKIITSEQITAEQLGNPLFTSYHINRHEKIDIDKYNTNLETINLDAKILSESLNDISSNAEAMARLSNNMKYLFPGLVDTIGEEIESAAKQLNLYTQNFVEDFVTAKHIDVEQTTAHVNLQAHYCTASSKINNAVRPSDISTESFAFIMRKGSSFSMRDDIKKILRSNNQVPVLIRMISNEPDGAAGSLVIPIRSKEINVVGFKFDPALPAQVTISATLLKGKTINITDSINVLGNIYETFDPITVNQLEIEVTVKEPTNIENNIYIYDFAMHQLYIDRTDQKKSTVLYSNQITFERPFTEILLRPDEKLPANTKVNYEISTNNETWLPIFRSTDNNEQPLSVGEKAYITVDEISETTTQAWSTIKPEVTYSDNPLYNILEFATSNITSEDTLDIPSNMEMVKGSAKLFRGYNNYALRKDKVRIRHEVSGLEYVIPTLTTVSGDVEEFLAVKAFVEMKDEVKIVNNSYQVDLRYTPRDDDVAIHNGKRSYSIINVSGKTVNILPASGVSKREKVYVTYKVLLETIEEEDNVFVELDEESISLHTKKDLNPTSEVSESDYEYIAVDKKVKLSRNADIRSDETGDSASVYASFIYYVMTKEEALFYETHILLSDVTKLKIFPFTLKEISFGNKHKIDGSDYSQSTEVELQSGWHIIQTTQPFKTDPNNPNDVNSLTGEPSNAAILLRPNGVPIYDEMIAFDQSLRQVDTFRLSNIVSPGDHRSFAIQDNKVLINFIPESLPITINSVNSHLTCRDILGKKAIYISDVDYSFDRYEVIPDEFKLEFQLAPKDGTNNAVKNLWYRATMTIDTDDSGKSPKIERVEILTR